MEIDNMSFEDIMKSLESIANELESGKLNLDESVEKFEEGIKLSKKCNEILDKAEKKISMLVLENEDEIKEQGMESLIPQLKFEIETIRTTKYDKNIDRYECAADFKMIGNANTTTLPITYTVESTDKKGEFYVSVDGF